MTRVHTLLASRRTRFCRHRASHQKEKNICVCRKSTWPFIRWMDHFFVAGLAFFSIMHNVHIDETQGLVCLCSSSGWSTNIRLDAALEWKYKCMYVSFSQHTCVQDGAPAGGHLLCLANQSRVTVTCCRPATGPPCSCMHR